MAVIFYAKAMLFGEYSLIAGSDALTIPHKGFSGWLDFEGDDPDAPRQAAIASNRQLQLYFRFLVRPEESSPVFSSELDLERLGKDLENGLFFRSTIPSGYGLGSSGALVAAIYHRYAKRASGLSEGSADQLTMLRKRFAAMESFFHGTSSGIDPLSCYAGRPLLLEGGGEVRILDQIQLPADFRGGFFLLDTGMTGKTGPLVRNFTGKTAQPAFHAFMKEEYIPVNDACISALLQQNVSELLSLLPRMSSYQRTLFLPMIPESMLEVWDEGLNSGAFFLKLCGSGGGGYLLGFTADYSRIATLPGAYKPVTLNL